MLGFSAFGIAERQAAEQNRTLAQAADRDTITLPRNTAQHCKTERMTENLNTPLASADVEPIGAQDMGALPAEDFEKLFEDSWNAGMMRPGSVVTGTIVDIDKDFVVVYAGLKSEGKIPRGQFTGDPDDAELAIGDEVKVVMETVDDGKGETRLSREKARRAECWEMLEDAFENSTAVKGLLNGKVKGGFTVDINDIRAFLPGSLVDIRPLRETAHLEGRDLDFKVIKLDQRRNNVVVSRRAVLEEENSAEREALLASLQEGQEVQGVVKNLTDYGAFVDLGGIDGLLHITDMAWRRVRHPSEIVGVGDEVMVKILRFDREKNRVSLGMKQLGDDPWVDITRRYPERTRVQATVTNLTDYGCFAEIEEGVEGLVHVSEMDWTNRNVHPSKVVAVGDQIEVMVLDIDEDRRRISLGIKQCRPNPWDEFAASHKLNDRVRGRIKSITDFGIFVGLHGGIDGLVYVSDISWNEPGEQAVRRYSKGEEIDTVILSIDSDRERISLGIKQLDLDPFADYIGENPRGSVVQGEVVAVDKKEATVRLAAEVDGRLRAGEVAAERVEDVRSELSVGDQVTAKIIGVDRKNRTINLSVKVREKEEEGRVHQDYQTREASPGPTTLGDLIKAQMTPRADEGDGESGQGS